VKLKDYRLWIRGVAGLLLLLVLGVIGYEYATYEKLDLDRLAPFAETESYTRLVERIQAQPVGNEGFSFVALGDTRSNINIARMVLSEVQKENPAFIFANGDIVRRGRVEEYEAHHMRLVEMINPIPFVTAPGNHERGPNNDFATFKAIYGDLRFSFDYGDCRFIGFNNCDLGGVSSSDLTFLEEELSKPGAKHKFVTFHIPPAYLENAVESDGSRGFTWNADALHDLMVEHAVDHVFVGHIHGYATETIDGVRYTITGGAGADLSENLGEEGEVHNYVVIHVTPDGLKQEVVRHIDEVWERSPVS